MNTGLFMLIARQWEQRLQLRVKDICHPSRPVTWKFRLPAVEIMTVSW